MNEIRKRLKQQHGALFDGITGALFEADPIGINFESNTDEYDSEAGAIIPRLSACNSASDVNQVVFEEFRRWFDAESVGEKKAYEQVSEVIWRIWRDFNVNTNLGHVDE
jgi:hypothetical protein